MVISCGKIILEMTLGSRRRLRYILRKKHRILRPADTCRDGGSSVGVATGIGARRRLEMIFGVRERLG